MPANPVPASPARTVPEASYHVQRARAIVATVNLSLSERLREDARDEHLSLAAALDDLSVAVRALDADTDR